MSSSGLRQTRELALALSENERAELAHDLVASLDGPTDVGVAEAWDIEIMRRLAQIEDGTAAFVDADDLMRRLKNRSVTN
jgi:putative addiction module component (TIGR02574 family)